MAGVEGEGRSAGASRIEAIDVTVLVVPTDQPEADGTLSWDATTIVVVEARSDGVTGLGYTYGPSACGEVVSGLLADAVVGRDPLAVTRSWESMVAVARNATRSGAVGYAVSAVDTALWDLKARLLDIPLADLFGRVRDSVPVYGSGGFTTYSDEKLISQLRGWLDLGMTNVKIKIGEDHGRAARRDLHRIRLARSVIGPDVGLFVDANGAYHRKQAVRLLRAAGEAEVTWFEEPVSSDDLDGLREVRNLVEADVAAGEYGTDVFYFRRMCDAEAVDCLQVDATRCGGYTEWLRAAGVAHAYGLDVSAHCAPNLHVHVAAATSNLRHLEWFHDHARLESMLFSGTLDPVDGLFRPSPSPGNALTLNREAAERFRVGAAAQH